jgi:hypothetical protein
MIPAVKLCLSWERVNRGEGDKEGQGGTRRDEEGQGRDNDQGIWRAMRDILNIDVSKGILK